ncbi:hypothetical protein C0993_003929 [Termitomyces sp. T159_Od127]|nr:hypothetical protein C0993_003929 [Termitomyces sp. T159_Od127]
MRTSRDRKIGATPVQPVDLKRREKVTAAIVMHCKDIKRAKRVNDTENDARRSKLEEDKWTTNVRPLFVDCRGCGKTIKLDGRNPESYYRTNWTKHKKICRNILETERRQMSSFVPKCIFKTEEETTSVGSQVVTGDKLTRPLMDHVWKQTPYCPEQRISRTTSTMRPATWTNDGIELQEDGESFPSTVY